MSRTKGHNGAAIEQRETSEDMRFAIRVARDDIQIALMANEQRRPDVVARLLKEIDERLKRATRASA